MEWASESIIKKCQHTTQWWSYLRSERWRWKISYKAIKKFKMTLPLIFVSKKTKSKMFRFNESFTRLSAAELANFNMVHDRWCFNRFDEISNTSLWYSNDDSFNLSLLILVKTRFWKHKFWWSRSQFFFLTGFESHTFVRWFLLTGSSAFESL